MNRRDTHESDLSHLTRKLDLDSLRLFSVVCREGSYAKAARVEPLTASAVSKRIADLERVLGCILLERSNYGVRPTTAGDLVLRQWAEVASSLSSLCASPESPAVSRQQTFSLVADPISSRFLIFDCLSHVDAVDDSARVQVTQAQLSWLPIEYEKLGAHAAVWALAEQTGAQRGSRTAEATFGKFSQARSFRFFAEVCIVVVRQDHPLAALESVGIEDLEGQEVVFSAGAQLPSTPASGALGTGGMEMGLGSHVARPTWSHQIGATLNYLDTIPSGVVALMPTSARHLLHRFPGLHSLPLDGGQGCMGFGCTIRDDAWLGERQRLLEKLTGCRLVETAADFIDSDWSAPLDLGSARGPLVRPGAQATL